MAFRIFVDGHVGTTGLRIRDWLTGRDDVALVTLPEAQRKDAAARRDAICAADAAVLCLPDDAAREAAGWADGSDARIVDASTAHRVTDGWVYGLPELEPGQRQRIREASRVTNPGCYPSGFVLLARPLVDAGLLEPAAPLSIHALSGYTGGGRQMIERWEDPEAGLTALPFEAPYALDRVHKHAPEMAAYAGIEEAPLFVPSVGPFACGMRIQLPLPSGLRPAHASAKAIHEALTERYRGEPFVVVHPLHDEAPAGEHAFDPRVCNDTNRIELRVQPHPAGHVLLIAILDNLGKGASGAAIQCLNLMLGLDETAGLPR